MPQGYRDELVFGIRVDNAWITRTVSVICLEFTSPGVIMTRPMRTLHPPPKQHRKNKTDYRYEKSRAFFLPDRRCCERGCIGDRCPLALTVTASPPARAPRSRSREGGESHNLMYSAKALPSAC